MNLTTISLYIAVFIFTVAIIQVIFLAWSESRFIEKRKVKKRLMYISAGGKHGQEKLARYRKSVLKDIGAFERFIFSIPRLSELDKLLIKIKIPFNATLFILFSVTLGMLGFGIGYRFLPQTLAAVTQARWPFTRRHWRHGAFPKSRLLSLPRGLRVRTRC